MNAGQHVLVSGDVKYGDSTYRVATRGIIQQWKKGAYALVTLEYVDNDHNVTLHVRKSDIKAV